jgi:hypothetical protein
MTVGSYDRHPGPSFFVWATDESAQTNNTAAIIPKTVPLRGIVSIVTVEKSLIDLDYAHPMREDVK